jgi:DinB family protein
LRAVSPGVPESATRLLVANYALAHERTLKLVGDLTDEQFAKPLHPSVHSIGWQLWHIARWDDRLAEILLTNLPELASRHGAPRQLWTSESIGERWGFPAGKLGLRDTGTDMKDEDAAHLTLPGKSEVVDYARRAFAFADEVAGSLTDELILMESPRDPDHESVGQNVMYWIDHVNRHLGMMEAMKGQQGLSGSAT